MTKPSKWAGHLVQQPIQILDGRKCPFRATAFLPGELALRIDDGRPDEEVQTMHRACVRAMAGEPVVLPCHADYEPDLG